MRRVVVTLLLSVLLTGQLSPALAAPLPKPATNLRFEAGDRSLTLKWRNPVDDPNFAKVIVRFQASDAPGYIAQAPIIYQGKGERKFVDGLIDDGRYDFAVFAVNAAGEHNDNWWWYGGARTLKKPRITSSISDGTVLTGQSVTISGKLLAYEREEDVWLPLPDRPMYLQQRELPNGSWARVGDGRTGEGYEIDGRAQGSIRFEREPRINTEYRLYYPGFGFESPTSAQLATATLTATSTTDVKSGASPARLAKVRPRVAASVKRVRVKGPDRAVVTGSVRPSRTEQPVELQRRTTKGWGTVATRPLRSDHTYRLAYRPPRKGWVRLRVRVPSTRRTATGFEALPTLSL